jgi:DNA replication protein DnaC
MIMTHEELVGSLTELRLSGMKRDYADLARLADRDNKTYEQYLLMLVDKELRARQDAKVQRLLKEAKLPLRKGLENYDYKRVRGITAKDVNRLASGDFIRKTCNVVFFGNFGVGKTHLAIALATALYEKRFRCLFVGTL